MYPFWSQMPEQKGIVLTGRGTLGCTVCLWAAPCSLGKNPSNSNMPPVPCNQPSWSWPASCPNGTDEGPTQTEGRISTLQGGVLHKTMGKCYVYMPKKKQNNFLNRRSTVQTSPHKLYLFNSLQLFGCPLHSRHHQHGQPQISMQHLLGVWWAHIFKYEKWHVS